MAGGDDDDRRAVNKPIFPPYPEGPPIHNIMYAEARNARVPGMNPPPPQPPPLIERSDPPASMADEPVSLPPGDSDENYSDQMSEVLAKVGEEEVAKKSPVDGSGSRKNVSLTENLSTDPNLPVYMKRKRGRPRKHPLPAQRRPEGSGRRAGRPKSGNRALSRKIKKEPVDEPMMVEQMLEDELAERLPTEQSLALEEDPEENAIRFTDVGNHLPLLVSGQHLCAVCLSRHSHRQSSGMRRTRATSFKRFTSVICRTCNKFLCVAPRTDGRTCFDIYHSEKDFIRADLPEFNRKECGDCDVISSEFDDSPDLAEDANMLLQLLQVASGEINKVSDFDNEVHKDPLETSMETVFPEPSESQDTETGGTQNTLSDTMLSDTPGHKDTESTVNKDDTLDNALPESLAGAAKLDTIDKALSESLTGAVKLDTKDGQSQAITLLLKVLKNQSVLCVSETHQLRLERRPRKYNMTNRNAHATVAMLGGSPEETTRKYRRKGRPRKHVSTDEEGDELDDKTSNDTEGNLKLFSNLITPGTRRKYACGRCHAEFNLIARMKVHLKAHVERKTYSCTVCSASFRTKGKLAEHRKQHKTEKTHKCPKCEESFKKMILLRRHMRTHQDVKPYECRICSARFSYASSLKEHALNKHLGERPFKCSECDQGFIRQMNLLEHMRIHTGERPFKCPKCDQSFARKSGLKSHMISHTGEKKHMCATCGARFRHKIALTEHQRTHSGEKPFACTHCGQRFAASTTLRNHVRLHTGEKPHTCKVCGAGFAQRTSLNCHMKKHGIAPPESKSPRNTWTKNFKQAQIQDQVPTLDGQHAAPMTPDQGPPPTSHGPLPSPMHHYPEQQMTPQPQDYSDKSHLQGHGVHGAGGHGVGGHGAGGHGDAMMAQAVSMAFSKMVPDMLQGGMGMGGRRPESGPSPVTNTSQPPAHSMSHHQVHTHHTMAPSHRPQHEALQTGSGHIQTQPNHIRSTLLHSDVHGELERPSSHSNHGADIKPMPLTTTASPWAQDPNLPTFPFDPAFHPQMSQGFPGMLPGQPNHGHGYPEQPRFPFDNRFGMDAWPGHSNWKHKYQ